MEMRQIGPGMITQMQRSCGDCNGKGYMAKTKTKEKSLKCTSKRELQITRRSRSGEWQTKYQGEKLEMSISSYRKRNTISSRERGLICWLCRTLVSIKL